MHISNTLDVVDNFDAEGLHNIIANVLQMVLVDALVIYPHEFPQLEPYPLLKLALLYLAMYACLSYPVVSVLAQV